MRNLNALLSFLVLAVGAACCGQAAADEIERGRLFVTTHCGACHAVGRDDASPHSEAPPLRTLHQFYEVEDLEESLAEGIFTGHPAMPIFHLDPSEIGDVIAYLETFR